MSTIYISRSSGDKKWKAELPDGRLVRFGQKGYSDYTLHKDPLRMKRYVVRHGGGSTSSERPADVQRIMLTRTRDQRRKENWSANGINTAGFWSRWLLWSFPNIKNAARHIEKKVLKNKYKIKFRP